MTASLLRIGGAIVIFALLVRGFVCFRNVDQYSPDPDAYAAIAETLGKTGVYGLTSSSGQPVPTAYRPPLYPLLLSWLLVDGKLSATGVAVLHTFLGCLTVAATYVACLRLFATGQRAAAGILASILVIVDPILLHQSTLVMTETLATAIAATIVWWWTRYVQSSASLPSSIVMGMLLALGFFCRPTFLVWAVLLMAGAIFIPALTWRWRMVSIGMIAATVFLAVGGWMIRNTRAVSHPVWATTHGGYTLLLANNPLFYEYLRSGQAGSTWDAEPFLLAYSHRYDSDPRKPDFWHQEWATPGVITVDSTEHEDDQLAYEAAKSTIRREPAMFFWSCVIRVSRLWTPFPHRTGNRSWWSTAVIGIYYSLLYLAVAIGLWRLGRQFLNPKWWSIPTLVLTLSLVHAIYWSNIRMRAPAIPALAIIAAATVWRPERMGLSCGPPSTDSVC